VHKLENGEFDLVAVGRAILADPEWTMKIKKGKVNELKSFTKDAQEKLY
ncbi:12-oxophytodienoate reductase, partial [Pseudomonas aeruginosa]